MIKGYFLLLSFFLSINTIAQIKDKSTAIWYFGDSAGLDFRNCEPQILYDHNHWQHDGSISMSSENGDFLFYSNGTNFWNANHQLMPNSPNLSLGSGVDGTIAIKKPNSNNIYYLFNIFYDSEFYYNIIDMQLDGGLGDVSSDTLVINIPYSSFTNKLAGVHHANGEDIWIATHESKTDSFYSFLLTSAGLDTNIVISIVGSKHEGNTVDTDGQLKFSPDGTKAACAINSTGAVEIFEFDNSTGIFSNPVTINPVLQDNFVCGIEFSSNSQVLYAGFDKKVYQFDLSTYNEQSILNSTKDISYLNVDSSAYLSIGDLQLALDGKIYVAHETNNDYFKYLGIINKPNTLGQNCNYIDTGIYLGGNSSTIDLPNILASYLRPIDFEIEANTGCMDEETRFLLYDSDVDYQTLNWDFGSGNTTSSEINPTFIYNDIGNYMVSLSVKDQCKNYTVNKVISIFDRPDFSLLPDTTMCEGNTLILAPSFSSYRANDTTYRWNTTDISKNINVNKTGLYALTIGDEECLLTKQTQINYEDCSVEFSIPNIITPNDDGYNEYFSFDGVEEYFYQLTIFNRWGKEVFKDDFYKGNWNGSNLKDGNYYYQVKNLKDDSVHNGWVQIAR